MLDEMVGQDEIRKIILQEKARGAIVLLASHNSEDIRLLTDELYEVNNGYVIKK